MGLRWPEFDFSVTISVFRWPGFDFWNLTSFRWPEIDFSIVDSVVWSFVTAFESLALVAMLCFFFVFCGCTV
ncbi:hypothetical protein Syun_008106 [Stephania yunnanensis]|uniref:Transmembrane protein n=1 Tax=Stephania yunnanensis TaxID=152371 RepID=A0AAP0L0R9_9MAGN